jgi:hypothetical protein
MPLPDQHPLTLVLVKVELLIATASALSRASTEPRYSPLLRMMTTRQLRRLARFRGEVRRDMPPKITGAVGEGEIIFRFKPVPVDRHDAAAPGRKSESWGNKPYDNRVFGRLTGRSDAVAC